MIEENKSEMSKMLYEESKKQIQGNNTEEKKSDKKVIKKNI